MFKVSNKSKVFLLLTLNNFTTFSSVSIIDVKQVNIRWIQDCSENADGNSVSKSKFKPTDEQLATYINTSHFICCVKV